MEIYSEDAKDQISGCKCRECYLRESYSAELRKRNLQLLNEYAPVNRIEKIIISESPPKDQSYVYLKTSRCTPKKFGHHVFHDLGYVRSNGVEVRADEKEVFLRKMQAEGVLIMDCCHCSVNQMSDYSQSEERDRLVATCFDEHAGKEIDRLFEKYHPKMYFKFPYGRGDRVFRILKDKYGESITRIAYDGNPRGIMARTNPAGSPSAIRPWSHFALLSGPLRSPQSKTCWYRFQLTRFP